MSLKPIPAEKLLRILAKIGFEPVRTRGSHVFLRHADGRSTVIPIHSGEDVGRGLLIKILKDVGLTREEYLRLERGRRRKK